MQILDFTRKLTFPGKKIKELAKWLKLIKALWQCFTCTVHVPGWLQHILLILWLKPWSNVYMCLYALWAKSTCYSEMWLFSTKDHLSKRSAWNNTGPRWPSGLAGLASNHRQSPLCGVQVPQVALLKTCPNMTLAVEWDVKNPSFDFDLGLE